MKLKGKTTRPGLYKCSEYKCRKQFTVTVGTVFERSRVPLNKWLMAVHLMAASKKGISAHQIHRMLGVTYKTAWFMCHRIREAMKPTSGGLLGSTGGYVEADETYWGVRKDAKRVRTRGPKRDRRRGPAHKMAVFSMVERDGEKRSFHVPNVTAKTLGSVMKQNMDPKSFLITDEASTYKRIGKNFYLHESVNHSIKEYARGFVTTNTVEASFSLLKRGLIGTFHHVGEQHLQRYVVEFDFRWNNRSSLEIDDAERADNILRGIEGKRLTYRRPNSGTVN